MKLDRRVLIGCLGGAAAVAAMDSEAKAEALEAYLKQQLAEAVAARPAAGNHELWPQPHPQRQIRSKA
jgi:hypothetical protein